MICQLDFQKNVSDRSHTLKNDWLRTKNIFYNNPLMRQRTEGVGLLTKEDAIKLGVTGSVLRASNTPYDIRKAEPYDVYNEIDFKVQYMKAVIALPEHMSHS